MPTGDVPTTLGAELRPGGHLTRFIRDLVSQDRNNMVAILGAYIEEKGCPLYRPMMTMALFLYSYCQGCISSGCPQGPIILWRAARCRGRHQIESRAMPALRDRYGIGYRQ